MNPSAPPAPSTLPRAPDWLSQRATEIFDGLVSTLDKSSADTAVIAMAASRLEEVEITTALVEDNGRTYGTTTESGGTILAGGTLRVENNTALGTGAVRTTGSVLDYADGITLHNPIVIDSKTPSCKFLPAARRTLAL